MGTAAISDATGTTQTAHGQFKLHEIYQPLIVVLFALWFGLGAGGQTVPVSAPSAPVLSGCEYDYAPFCVVREDGQADGFSVQLLRAALHAMGREVTFKTAPWAELKQDLFDGRLQVLPMVARTPEREESFDFTFPYFTLHGTIVVRDDCADIRGPEDLRGKRVAVLQEDIAHEYLRTAGLGAVIVPLQPSFATPLRELSDGKHDAVVIQKLLAFQIMQKFGLKNLRTVGPPLTGYSQVFCFAVHKGDQELLSLLNEGLSIVVADGTFRQLHAEWFSALEAFGATKSRIIVGGDANYPPYEFLDSNGQPAGFNVDLTRAIARQMGLSVDIHLGPWGKVRAELDQGEIDIVHGMFYSAERDKRFEFSPPHAIVQHVIVVRKGAPPLADMQALAGKSILVMAGDILHDLAIQHGYAAQVVPVASQEEALRRLAAGAHDCALVARLPALYWIEKNHWTNLAVPEKPVLSAEYCYAVPDGRESLLAEFSEGLAAVKKTGEFRSIQTRWLGPYEETRVGFGTLLKYVLFGAAPLLVLLAGALLWTRSLQAQVRVRTRALQGTVDRIERAEAASRASEERLRLFVEHAPAALAMFDRDMRYVSASRRWLSDYGLEGGAVEGRSHYEVFPEIPDRWRAVHRRGLAGEVVRAEEDPFDRPDGTRQWLRWEVRPWHDAAGQVAGILIFSEDITERKRAEEALRRSEALLRAVLDSSPDPIYLKDRDGRMLLANPATLAVIGKPAEAVFGKTDAEFYDDPTTGRAIMETDRRIMESGQMEVVEESVVQPAGTRIYLSTKAPYRDADGRISGLIGVSREITARKAAEEALRLSEGKFASAFANNPAAIAMTRLADGVFLEVNDTWLALNGYRREEVLGRSARQMSIWPTPEAARQFVTELQEKGVLQGREQEFFKRSGELYVTQLSAQVLTVRGEKVVLSTLVDITGRKQMELDLKAARDSAEQAKAVAEAASQAKDRFLAVLSHELRTPLTPVLATVALLERDAALQPDVRGDLEVIRRNVELQARLIDDLLDVTRIARGKVELDRRPIELCTVIRRAVEVCTPDIQARRLHFGLELKDTPMIVVADAARLQQVFWNLLKNAIKFTPVAGCVGLRAWRENAQAVVEVSDSGEGIEPEAIGRIFNAFEQAERAITQKFGGLGLGLTISRGLVELHGGTIAATSAGRGRGATFTVRLPLCVPNGDRSCRPEATAYGASAAAGGLRILLVEDHGDTARIITRLLTSVGHDVHAAGDVKIALAEAAQHEFDLLISDLGLPDGSGLDLMRALRARGCRFPAIALTGYGQEEDVQRTLDAGFATHLTKPVDFVQLERAIKLLCSR